MDDLIGRWCGDTANYTFDNKKLTVKFSNGQDRVLEISKVTPDGQGLKVWWVGPPKADGSDNATVFDIDRDVLVQRQNGGGDKGPRREFHRC